MHEVRFDQVAHGEQTEPRLADEVEAGAPVVQRSTMLPTFVGIGAQRAGTTWIHQCLREHPEICVPQRKKELHFFNGRRFEEGVDWYVRQFDVQPQHKAVGEITPNYLSSKVALPRMAEVIPEARLFVVLREPVERAYSAYCLLRSEFEGMSFRQACEHRVLVGLGMYSDQIDRVFRYYPRERVFVRLYDDLVSHPRRFLRDLHTFLGVDPGFIPSAVNVRYNRVVYPTGQDLLKRMRLTFLLNAVKKAPLGRLIRRVHVASGGGLSDAASEADIRHLKQLFHDDVVRLQTLIGRDLSHWM